MGSFLYLYQKIIVNKIKKALRRPATYIFVVVIVGYIVMMGSSLGMVLRESNLNSPENLAVVLSGLIFFFLPANFISYSRRKGLLFRQSDIHFTFPAPVNPKMVLLFTGMKNLALNVVMTILILLAGIQLFDVDPLWMLLYAVIFLVSEDLLESSMMILCYGSQKLKDGFFKGLTVVLYLLMGTFVAAAVALAVRDGHFSFSIVSEYLSLPIVQMIPVIGWNIALTRLFFVGPTTLNVICSILFCISAISMFLLAYRMKCEGEYYEDAAKFADDYEVLRANKKKGIVSVSMGKKKKFKSASVEYKGVYGKAIYYRQLLEYKKTRFFIFGWNSLLCLGIGVVLAAVAVYTDLLEQAGSMRVFILPGVIAYVIFIFSGYATKWSRELENPYTYLIPDSCFRKLWYATKIEHIRALVDGTLMTVPGAVVMGLSPLQTILIILLYVCLMANKLYFFMLADAILGKTLGTVGRTFLKMLFQCIAIGIGILAAFLGGLLIGLEAGFVIMIVVTVAFTFLGALGAATSFKKMEAPN